MKETFGLGQFGGKDQDIKSEVSATTSGMEVLDDKREIGFGKVFRSQTGIERGQAKVNRVGSGGHRGLETIPVPRRGQKFRFSRVGHPKG